MKDHSDSLTDEEQLADCAGMLQSDPAAAAALLRTFIAANPLSADAYRLLAAADRAASDSQGSGGIIQSSLVSGASMRLQQAAGALESDDLEPAEIILRHRLLQAPSDVDALRLMAMLATRLDFPSETEELLRLTLEIAPDYDAAALDLASWLNRQNRPLEALTLIAELLEREPNNRDANILKAHALERAGHFEEAARLLDDLLKRAPSDANLWSQYGSVLKTMGRSDDGLRAIRHAVDIAPLSGEAWWTLSNLKTARFDPADILTMLAALKRDDLNDDDRFKIHFALGKGFEDEGDPAQAFAHYADANELRLKSLEYYPDEISSEVTAARQAFSRQFFVERQGQGCGSDDPIFIVGMPRSGSTLIEQILASHPQIEGTMELPNVPAIAKNLGRGKGDYIGAIANLTPERFRQLGEGFLEQTRSYRNTDRPFFIDKMPNNWAHVPLIQLILPNAKIIDARRHPLACGFSNFKQHFVRGQGFSYDLSWMGRYYADYVRLMAHIDTVLPARVHRVIHEELVDHSDREIRRMLDFLGLPFNEACVRFHENERAVRTPSSEQVRRPINRNAVNQWRAFEPWLGPLMAALGPVLDCYPDAPTFPPA